MQQGTMMMAGLGVVFFVTGAALYWLNRNARGFQILILCVGLSLLCGVVAARIERKAGTKVL